MRGKEHVKSVACSLFARVGFDKFYIERVINEFSYVDLKALILFHYVRDVYNTGECLEFTRNPNQPGQPVPKHTETLLKITDLEDKIWHLAKERAVLAAIKGDTEHHDLRIRRLMIEMEIASHSMNNII